MIKVAYYWEMAPDADIDAFEKWYYEVHVEDVKVYPGLKKYVLNKAVTEGVPEEPGVKVYRTAELFFDSFEDIPQRLKRVPPISDITDYGAINLRRVYYESEDVQL